MEVVQASRLVVKRRIEMSSTEGEPGCWDRCIRTMCKCQTQPAVDDSAFHARHARCSQHQMPNSHACHAKLRNGRVSSKFYSRTSVFTSILAHVHVCVFTILPFTIYAIQRVLPWEFAIRRALIVRRFHVGSRSMMTVLHFVTPNTPKNTIYSFISSRLFVYFFNYSLWTEFLVNDRLWRWIRIIMNYTRTMRIFLKRIESIFLKNELTMPFSMVYYANYVHIIHSSPDPNDFHGFWFCRADRGKGTNDFRFLI